MKLALGQITEAVGPMATEGAGAAATVEVEVAGRGEEGSKDIKPSGHYHYLKATRVVP